MRADVTAAFRAVRSAASGCYPVDVTNFESHMVLHTLSVVEKCLASEGKA